MRLVWILLIMIAAIFCVLQIPSSSTIFEFALWLFLALANFYNAAQLINVVKS